MSALPAWALLMIAPGAVRSGSADGRTELFWPG